MITQKLRNKRKQTKNDTLLWNNFFFLIIYKTCLHPQIIDECVLCVHGGLSPDIKTIDQIRTIERNQEIPHKGAFCDILFLYLTKY